MIYTKVIEFKYKIKKKQQMINSALCLPDFAIQVTSAHYTNVCWPLWPK